MTALSFVLSVPMLLGVVIGTTVLILSMRLISQALGGIDFGEVETAVFKGAVLVLTSLAVSCYFPFGIWLDLPIWFLGILILFGPGVKPSVVVAALNWVVSMAIVSTFKALEWWMPKWE